METLTRDRSTHILMANTKAKQVYYSSMNWNYLSLSSTKPRLLLQLIIADPSKLEPNPHDKPTSNPNPLALTVWSQSNLELLCASLVCSQPSSPSLVLSKLYYQYVVRMHLHELVSLHVNWPRELDLFVLSITPNFISPWHPTHT